MKVFKYLVPILVVVSLLGAVGIAQLAGAWTTSGRGVLLTDAEGNPDPAGIKGWMTLQMISETYGIPLDVLYERAGIPAEVSPETEVKSLEGVVPGFETETLRTAVADYLSGAVPQGTPAPLPESTPAPTPQAAGGTTAVPATRGAGEGDGTGEDRPTSTPLPAGQLLPAAEIKGRMTLREIAELCGVPLEYLVEKLELPAGVSPDTAAKDLSSQYGIEVETVRTVVADYQAQPRP